MRMDQPNPDEDWVHDFELWAASQPIQEILGQKLTDEFLNELYWCFDPVAQRKKLRDMVHQKWIKQKNGNENHF